jgi:hypothetical protein
MRLPLSPLVLALFTPYVLSEDALRSGPQPGQEKNGPFLTYTWHINGPKAGKHAFASGDLFINPRPSVFVFTRSMEKSVIELAKKLETEATQSNLFVSVVLLGQDQKPGDRLKAVAKQESIRAVILSYNMGIGDEKIWQITKEAEITVLLYTRERRLLANFAYRPGEFNEKAIRAVVRSLSVICRPIKQAS